MTFCAGPQSPAPSRRPKPPWGRRFSISTTTHDGNSELRPGRLSFKPSGGICRPHEGPNPVRLSGARPRAWAAAGAAPGCLCGRQAPWHVCDAGQLHTTRTAHSSTTVQGGGPWTHEPREPGRPPPRLPRRVCARDFSTVALMRPGVPPCARRTCALPPGSWPPPGSARPPGGQPCSPGSPGLRLRCPRPSASGHVPAISDPRAPLT